MTDGTAHLLYDSVSPNTGDIAMGVAAGQLFAERGLGANIVDPFGAPFPRPLVVGGGELIRQAGDAFYDSFRPRGRHILNSAGVWTSADSLDYLNEYAFVSARSARELEVLQAVVPEATLLPCATTMITSQHHEIEGVDPEEVVVGIHLVPHSLRLIEDLVPIIDSIPHKKVFIPFTHYNGDASFMRNLPFNKENSVTLDHLTPLQLHSVISQMSYVVVSSLHASIFAYSQNVPFASIHQKKAEYYFQDRNLAGNLVRSDRELIAVIDRLNTESFDFTELVARDKKEISLAFDNYSEFIRSERFEPASPLSTLPSQRRDLVLMDQAQMVIGDRDLALSYTESRRLRLATEKTDLLRQLEESRRDLSETHQDLKQSQHDLEEIRHHVAIEQARWWRRGPRWIKRRLRRLVRSGLT